MCYSCPSVGLLTVGTKGISDSFTSFWNSTFQIGLLCPTLTWGGAKSYCTLICHILLTFMGDPSFLNRNRGVDWGMGTDGGGNCD